MKKAAAKVGLTTTDEDELTRRLEVFAARKQFLGYAANMSWQLALTIVIPVIIGVQLDKHYNTSPTWVLIALFVAVGMASMIVWRTVRSVNKAQGDKK